MRGFDFFLWILHSVLSDSETLYLGRVFWKDTQIAWEVGKCLFNVDLRFLLELQVRMGDEVKKWIFRLHVAPQPFAEIKIL